MDELIGNFRVDLIVEDKVVVEVKSLAGNIPIYLSVDRQFLSLNYFLVLKASGLHVYLSVDRLDY